MKLLELSGCNPLISTFGEESLSAMHSLEALVRALPSRALCVHSPIDRARALTSTHNTHTHTHAQDLSRSTTLKDTNLSHIARLSCLTYLSFSDTSIGDEGIMHLANGTHTDHASWHARTRSRLTLGGL
jgi:hypothetical protein